MSDVIYPDLSLWDMQANTTKLYLSSPIHEAVTILHVRSSCLVGAYAVPLGVAGKTRDLNRWDASANSRVAFRTSRLNTPLPSLPCSLRGCPPSMDAMLLNASPTLSRSCRLSVLNLAQSTTTCTTVSAAPHTHRSSSLNLRLMPYVASQE